jgi:hypothetical protein
MRSNGGREHSAALNGHSGCYSPEHGGRCAKRSDGDRQDCCGTL